MAAQCFDIIQDTTVEYIVIESDGKFPNQSAEKAEIQIAKVYTSVSQKKKK